MTSITSGVAMAKEPGDRYLISAGWDFALLGGGSMFALVVLRLVLGHDGLTWSFAATAALANVVNHPHFAHSYQIFYRDFRSKLSTYPRDLRYRYLFSGIVVPLVLVIFFVSTIMLEAPRALGVGANLMFFLVGWHYVKQGYGMAMVDAVLKRAFYTDHEKRRLLQNGYAVWIFSWLLINHMGVANPKYFNIPYFALPVPIQLVALAGLACTYTTVRVYVAFRQRVLAGRPVAWNGVLAYTVSLYAWLLIRDPIVLVWVPLFHSLQYMTVVWRYEINRVRSASSQIRPALRFTFFSVSGFGLGYLGFWALPQWLDVNVDYSKEIFGSALFLYVFWIFINVHHYAVDTVMWRKGNPDVQKHLFSHRS